MDKNVLYEIAITFLEDIGDVRAKALIAYCGNAEAVFKEKPSNLEKIPGIGQTLSKIKNKKEALRRAEEEMLFIYENKIVPLFYTDKKFPKRLLHCNDGPVLLYTRGAADLNAEKMVAIVGTRKATDYGKTQTEKLVKQLQEYNVSVVSGMAYGIDVSAHKACLQLNMPTIGVFAHGLDMVYPPKHQDVAEEMLIQGALVTDFPGNTIPDAENFPKRNRIVAGMCDATIVIEAAKSGGALITADIANSYNRDVFAVPGRLGEKYSEGCNNLIKTNRAALLNSAADLAYIMGWELQSDKKKKAVQTNLFTMLDADEKNIVNLLQQKGKSMIDDISLCAQLPVSKTASLLLKLEFAGLVKSLPGKLYELY